MPQRSKCAGHLECRPGGAIKQTTPDAHIGQPCLPVYLHQNLGKRDLGTATAFLCDLSERLTNRIQLSSDALAA